MVESISLNTQAILLLTAPLLDGKSNKHADILKPSEYNRLARHLKNRDRKPADLLKSDAEKLLEECHTMVSKDRLRKLLDRGVLLTQAIDRWQARTIWVVSRADSEYPRILKDKLKTDAPAVLYGCGNRELLNSGGLAVVGSRKVNQKLSEYAREIGHFVASSERVLISGGAKGIDIAAMRGAWEAGGKVVGVLAHSLSAKVVNRENRNMIMKGLLVLVSPYDPSAGFNVGHAMARNKLIYALADDALVVNADFKKGGTWNGAEAQLKKWHFVRNIYVRSTGDISEGLEGLKKIGALPWPNPKSGAQLNDLLSGKTNTVSSSTSQPALPFGDEKQTKLNKGTNLPPLRKQETLGEKPRIIGKSTSDEAADLLNKVKELIVQLLNQHGRASASDIASLLSVMKGQASEWLTQFTREGILEKDSKSGMYMLRREDTIENEPLGEGTIEEPIKS